MSNVKRENDVVPTDGMALARTFASRHRRNIDHVTFPGQNKVIPDIVCGVVFECAMTQLLPRRRGTISGKTKETNLGVGTVSAQFPRNAKNNRKRPTIDMYVDFARQGAFTLIGHSVHFYAEHLNAFSKRASAAVKVATCRAVCCRRLGRGDVTFVFYVARIVDGARNFSVHAFASLMGIHVLTISRARRHPTLGSALCREWTYRLKTFQRRGFFPVVTPNRIPLGVPLRVTQLIQRVKLRSRHDSATFNQAVA